MNNPNDVTHIDDDGGRYSYLGENTYSVWMDNEKIPYWREMPHNNIECASNIRSVSDVKRIEELEKERAIGVYHFTVDEYKAHKLEQQAIGAYESVWFCKFEGVRTDEQPNRHISHLLNARVKELRNQAKTLREQGNEHNKKLRIRT
jgi:hypothetical protein